MTNMTDAQQALLVVYAVLWAAITPAFARLRAFSINDLARRPDFAWRRVLLRFTAGAIIGNVGLAATLALLWRYLPDASGAPGILAGALAGITPAVFPRLLHALLASEKTGPFFYPDEKDWHDVLRRWDKVWYKAHKKEAPGSDSRRANRATAHLTAALLVAVLSTGLGWLVAVIASPSEGASEVLRLQTLHCTLEVVTPNGASQDDEATIVLLQGGGGVLSVPPFEASIFVGETLGQDSMTLLFEVTGPDDFRVRTGEVVELPIDAGARLGSGGGGPGTGDSLNWSCLAP